MSDPDLERQRRLAIQAADREAMKRAAEIEANNKFVDRLFERLVTHFETKEEDQVKRVEQTMRDLKPPTNGWRQRAIQIGVVLATAALTYFGADWIDNQSQTAVIQERLKGVSSDRITKVEGRVDHIETQVTQLKKRVDMGFKEQSDKLDKLLWKFKIE
jgi:anti-sigma factor RsiW